MESRAAIVVSCWFAVAIISVAYMWLFANKVGDILFGVFLPIGLLILVAMIVTFGITSRSEPENKREAKYSKANEQNSLIIGCRKHQRHNAQNWTD